MSVVVWVALCGEASAQPFGFDDIDFWVGSGANRAAMVIDWNDGKHPQSVVWGYRWDGTATSQNMLMAIAGTTVIHEIETDAFISSHTGADPRLYARLSQFTFGDGVFGLGYDHDGDGGTFTPGFEGSETGFSADPDDRYAEGWFDNGFWAGSGSNGDPFDGGSWEGFTFLGREIQDGDWEGWSFAPGFTQSAPSHPLPEPTTAVLLAGACAACLVTRRTG